MKFDAKKVALGGALATLGLRSFAVGTDFSTLTAAVDFTTVVTAVLAIGAILMVPKVAVWGTRKVLAMVRG